MPSGIFIIATLLLFPFSVSNAESERGEAKVRFLPSRSVAAMPGKVEIIESSSEYSCDLKAFGKLPLELSLDTQYIGIENTTRIPLPAHLTRLSWGAETTLPFLNFNKTYLRIGVRPSFYTDNWDFDSSGFRIPARSFLIYQPDDKWTYILGVAVYPDFRYEVLPILGFIYKPNDKLSFNIVPDRPNINYALNEKTDLFTEFDASWDEFEVTRNNSENVVLTYKERHLGAGARYKFNKFVQSSISAGGIFGRSLSYRDNEGKAVIRDGLYTEFRINIQI